MSPVQDNSVYFSQIGIGGAAMPPTVSESSVLPGARKPPGTRTLICIRPTRPGALPANRRSIGTPATVITTGSSGCANGTPAGRPEIFGPSVRPSPVAYKVRTAPAATGSVSLFADPSGLMIIGTRDGLAAATGRSIVPAP